MQSIRPARPPMLESQEIPGVTPIQQKEALEADSIPHGPAFRGKSVSQSDLANNSALIAARLDWVKAFQIGRIPDYLEIGVERGESSLVLTIWPRFFRL